MWAAHSAGRRTSIRVRRRASRPCTTRTPKWRRMASPWRTMTWTNMLSYRCPWRPPKPVPPSSAAAATIPGAGRSGSHGSHPGAGCSAGYGNQSVGGSAGGRGRHQGEGNSGEQARRQGAGSSEDQTHRSVGGSNTMTTTPVQVTVEEPNGDKTTLIVYKGGRQDCGHVHVRGVCMWPNQCRWFRCVDCEASLKAISTVVQRRR